MAFCHFVSNLLLYTGVNYGSDVFRAFLFISNVEVYLFDEDIWMTQAALADLL